MVNPKYKIGQKVHYKWCLFDTLHPSCVRKGRIEHVSDQKGKYYYKMEGVEGIYWETDILSRYQSIKIHFQAFWKEIT